MQRNLTRLLSWLIFPLLFLQGLWVRNRTPRLDEAAGPKQGRVGKGGAGQRGADQGQTLQLLALGDSIIAGVGVATTVQALPAQLSVSLSRRLRRKVSWTSQGFNGARTRDLLTWTAESHWAKANLVIVSNGLNDITSLMQMSRWQEEVVALFIRLRKAAPRALIAQLGIPPLGHFPALPQPLRSIMGQRARAFDAALEEQLKPLPGVVHLPFREAPDPDLFAADGYHPGPEAVRIWAQSLAELIVEALIER